MTANRSIICYHQLIIPILYEKSPITFFQVTGEAYYLYPFPNRNLSLQQLLYSLFVVRINQHNLFSDILKSVDDTLIVCLQRFHRTI